MASYVLTKYEFYTTRENEAEFNAFAETLKTAYNEGTAADTIPNAVPDTGVRYTCASKVLEAFGLNPEESGYCGDNDKGLIINYFHNDAKTEYLHVGIDVDTKWCQCRIWDEILKKFPNIKKVIYSEDEDFGDAYSTDINHIFFNEYGNLIANIGDKECLVLGTLKAMLEEFESVYGVHAETLEEIQKYVEERGGYYELSLVEYCEEE